MTSSSIDTLTTVPQPITDPDADLSLITSGTLITINDKYRNQRLKDLESVPNWYPHLFPITKTFKSYRETYDYLKPDEIRTEVIEYVSGRILTIRASGGNLYFATMESGGYLLQILANASYYASKDIFKAEKKILKGGDVVGVIGHPTRSAKGELSILPTSVQLLAPCLHSVPKDFYGLENMAVRFNQRYLDFIVNRENRKIIETRSKVYKFIRNFLDERDFLEVETPVLSTKLGGANAKPFITYHNDIGKEMFMRIAPELYLKQLIIGGFERVYELGKQFRNESIDLTHFTEFSSIEIYQTHADYFQMMELTEQIFSKLVEKICGSMKITYKVVDHSNNSSRDVEIDFTPPFKRLDLMTDLQREAGFEFPPEILANFDSEQCRQFLTEICIQRNVKCSPPQTIPRLLDKLVGEYLEPLCQNPTFITNHPQIMSPLAKYHRSNPLLTERFEMFIVGREFANAYTELNDPRTQRACFEKQAKDKAMGDSEAQPTDTDFILALEYGLPPTGGLGIGIDRLIMLLTNQSSIKEVLTFSF